MKPTRRLEILGMVFLGWLPAESAAANPHVTPRPWWWQPTWSLGIFLAEAGILNLFVPVSTLGFPLFLANMWLSFVVGGIIGSWIGKRSNYLGLSREPGWKAPRWFIVLPIAVVELAVGVGYFSVDNWVYVSTNCLTGNACTFFQIAPVLFLILGVITLPVTIIGVLRSRRNT